MICYPNFNANIKEFVILIKNHYIKFLCDIVEIVQKN